MNKEQLLIAEYTAISEHFRTYQSNRLTIVLLTIPVVGAIMLNALEKHAAVQIFCFFMLYLIILFNVQVDNVFMKRLRNYTIRLAEIEKEFNILGHASKRLGSTENATKDATTNAIRQILYALNALTMLYSVGLMYTEFFEEKFKGLWDPIPLASLALCIPVCISIAYFFIIATRVNSKRLPNY